MTHAPEVVAIIPARGGSKGIPRKNIRLVGGKPLLAYNIEAARGAQTVHRVIVSTDDDEIAAVARQYGAEVVKRPADISGDTAKSEDALLHVLSYLAEHEHYTPDLLVFLQATSPLTLPEDIDGAVQKLITEQADSALTATPFYYFLWKVADDGSANGINHDKSFRPRRQDLAPQYLENGAVYVMLAAGFQQAKHRFFGKTVLHIMPPERHWEIDEPVDLTVAEVLIQVSQNKG
jgi:N-acylneuraminate cytidylyltransferase